MIADHVRDLRALLREAACALSAPLAQYDHSLSARLWAAYDALAVADLQHASTAPISSNPPPLAAIVAELAEWVATLADGSDFDNASEMQRAILVLADRARGNHPAIPDGSRDDRRDHDRHSARVL